MESRLLDCLEQTWLFQRDVVSQVLVTYPPSAKLQWTCPVSFSFHILLVG